MTGGRQIRSGAIGLNEFVHHGACVVRTPLLPFDVLRDDLSQGDLLTLLADPIVREALFLASPSLDSAIDAWLANPYDRRAYEVELTVRRYIARMAFRPTPFGLFSGCAIATIAESTSLTVCERQQCRRKSRLDMHYLGLVAEALERDRDIRATLRFRANSTIAFGGDQLRYVEAHSDPEGRGRRFHFMTGERSAAVMSALDAASTGATIGEIASAVLRDSPNVPRGEACAFVDELVDAQVLESNVQPAVAGEDPLTSLANTLRLHEKTRAVGDRLTKAAGALQDLDTLGPGAPRERYRAIMATLEPVGVPLDPSRLFQVDLYRSGEDFCVGEGVIDEVQRAVALLHRITPVRGTPAMRRFRERFTQRYGEREVPLVDALDEERGLGFDLDHPTTMTSSALLAGIAFPSRPATSDPAAPHDRHKLRRLLTLLEAGQREWVLDDADIDALTGADRAPLPDALGAMVAVAARSNDALNSGDFQLLVHHITGPYGATLLARFCHGDPAIRALVERHVREEEERRPDAVFAEIVHLPEGRLGNILCRPVLRSHEIPYLGASTALPNQRIEINDLHVSVQDGAVRLRSMRLDREILPRLSSAHTHSTASLPVYRFLCALQGEGLAYLLRWSWGSLESSPSLPRVRHGRIVLSLATWTIEAREIRRVARDATFRSARDLPRWVGVVEHDSVLPIDFESDSAEAQLSALARGRQHLQLQELFPSPDDLCAAGTEGRYAHQIVVPLVRAVASPAKPLARWRGPSAIRTFSPGTEWLYAKIYTGPTAADRVLCTLIAPIVQELRTAKLIDQWFFIRYADPEPHLRVRFHGDPDRLLRDVLPRLRDGIAPLVRSGCILRLQLDTYERELERYGGKRSMPIAERIFTADSDAALAIVEMTAGDAGADARWRLALYGMHAMLIDADVDVEARRALVARARDAFTREHEATLATRHSLGTRYRTERGAIEHLLSGTADADEEIGPMLSAIRARSAALVPCFAELRALHEACELETPWDDLLRSFVHMHVNRVVRADQRAHEMVLYDFLHRAYDSVAARARERR